MCCVQQQGYVFVIFHLVPIILNASIQVLNVSHVVINITLSPYGQRTIMYYEVRHGKWLFTVLCVIVYGSIPIR